MSTENSFIDLLKKVKTKLFKHFILQTVGFAFFCCLTVILFFTLLQRFLTISTPLVWLVSLSLVTIGITFFIRWKNNPTLKDAAAHFDNVVGEDRVKTALNYQEDEHWIAVSQRRETVQKMKKNFTEVMQLKKIKVHKGKLALSFIFVSIVALSHLFPSESMLIAQNMNVQKELNKKTLEELEEKVEEEELEEIKEELLEKENMKLDDHQSSEEFLKDLMSMEKELALESGNIEEIVDEYEEKMTKSDSDMFSEALEFVSQQDVEGLESWLDSLEANALNELVKEWNELESEQLSEQELAELLEAFQEEMNELLANMDQLAKMKSMQQMLQQLASNHQLSMLAAGISSQQALTYDSQNSNSSSASTSNGSNQGQSSGSNSTSGSQDNKSNNADSNSEQSDGNQSSNDGEGSGNSSNSGSGNGTGSGSGNGSGSGSGSGNGAGLGLGSRELAIPERLEGQTNIEEDYAELGEGESTIQQSESPALKGNIRPYEEVLGQYENLLRQNIDRKQLPSHLEGIIEGYFSELK
ncbi:hypothetical protein [Alkalihalobacillus trypoxylicola]|uniref:DUF4175 domain-containing protein n=1 Tax=Alkalihalobacillus trypoxylicola TaxID=519424 RepID=A0A162CM78_9BACI|nr:hypothetical protein [Alkalihalobacillus trypoxylicola]KYG25544.1 hypothetical protein AZF04_13720 [Alkalihalobacillus trypoxylicola]